MQENKEREDVLQLIYMQVTLVSILQYTERKRSLHKIIYSQKCFITLAHYTYHYILGVLAYRKRLTFRNPGNST